MKKIINFLYLCFFCYIIIFIFIHKNYVNNTLFEAINLWYFNVIPNLLPMFLIGPFLLNYGLIYYLSIFFKKPFIFLFKCNYIGIYVFFMSILSGFPSSAKYIVDLYERKLISDDEATKLLTFTHFANPLFILGFIKPILGFKCTIIVLIVHYITNVFIGILFRNMSDYNDEKPIISKEAFGTILKSSITKTIETLLTILGTIVFFMILNTVIKHTNLPPFLKYISNLFLEMTSGIIYVSSLNTSFKAILLIMIISFGGLSVHFQVLSIISDTKIKYQPYFLARLLHALIAGIIVFIINILM